MQLVEDVRRYTHIFGDEYVVYTEHQIREALRRRFEGAAQGKRVFGIGAIRTGTLSLTKALSILGIPAIHRPYSNHEPEEGWIDWIKNAPWQGFTDHPFSDHLFFEELDEEFPDARFILTTREDASWKESVYEHEQRTKKQPSWEEVEEWNERRKEHERKAKEHFGDDLLVLPLEAEEKWERLCGFLEKEVPDRDYPHLNRRENLVRTAYNYYFT